MKLRKSLFFVAVGLYVIGLLAAVAMLAGIAIKLFRPNAVDILLPVWVFVGCLSLRLIITLWLRKLGGAPEEFRTR